MNKQIVNMIINWIIFCFVPVSACTQTTSDKIDVLIVDGFSNHNWEQTTYITKTILEKSGLFNVSVTTTPSEPQDKTWDLWRPDFNKYDVVIQNTNNISNKEIKWPREVEKNLEKYVKSGGGLYILHSANNSFSNWNEYNLMIGLGWRSKDEGVAIQITNDKQLKTIPAGEGKATYHGPRNDEIIYILNNHPINEDFPKAWKTPDMELYKYARGPAKNLTVLSYAKEAETNINWPVEWIVKYGNGKVYNSSMGHLWEGDSYPVSFRCVGFQTTLIRVTQWLATGKVSYKIPKDFPTKNEIKLVEVNLID